MYTQHTQRVYSACAPLDGHPLAHGRSQRASEEAVARLRPSESLPCSLTTLRPNGRHILRRGLQATGALVHENEDGTTAAVHGAAEAYLAEFREKVGKGELTYEDGWVEVTK